MICHDISVNGKLTGYVRYPADLHAIGRLLHLFSEGVCFGPGWGKITGMTGGLA